ncbi:MAG: ABC transporter permease [Gammaproteobacteria bacterium]|nr:ABC transporter permease [Gammaproteobacteria bacterium]MBK79657.1 ABC transporter permease [Gammaproteobacteria bacterium]
MPTRELIALAWRDLSARGHALWVFCTCLALGVTLVAATGGLYRQVTDALFADTRALAGGDLEVAARQPLPAEAVDWMAATGTVAQVVELDTMMGTTDGGLEIVELQSVDDAYPLYGTVALSPAQPLADATGYRDGRWGVAVDPVLADRLALGPGDTVEIGSLTLTVRATIEQQPDRSLSADWRGAPVLIAADALEASGLVTPASRVEYEYRLRTDADPQAWQDRFFAAFPDAPWEVRTFTQQSQRIAERLGQVASGLLVIGFSTLFIGGLGVFNSVHAYLQGKLRTIATLRALGLRDRSLAAVYLLQIGAMAGAACLVGAAAGYLVGLVGAGVAETQVRMTTAAASAVVPALAALAFGMIIAFTFSLPALGRALSVQPAALFRNAQGAPTQTPASWWAATAAGCALIVALVLTFLPDPLFALGFVATVAALLGLLELLVRGIRRAARRLEDGAAARRRFPLRLALANLHRPGSALRTCLLSLGSALTLLVACTTVVAALVQTIATTIPEDAPGLVLYDIAGYQREPVVDALNGHDARRVDIAPLVQARLTAVNGEALADSDDPERRREARDEHKLTHPADNIDGVTLVRGAWWDLDADLREPRAAMEDREADQLGLEIGDRLTFVIEDRPLTAELAGIYRQNGLQTRFWFEAILSQGSLDPFVSRWVGAAYLDDADAIAAQRAIAERAPNVVTVRTASILATAGEVLGKATAGLGAVGAVALAVSLLVLTSVVATSRARQVYDATVLHALGARLGEIRASLNLEYLLLAVVTSAFALILGLAIAVPLLHFQLKLPLTFPLWPAVLAACGVSGVCLNVGARYLLRRLRLRPALLLRQGQ